MDIWFEREKSEKSTIVINETIEYLTKPYNFEEVLKLETKDHIIEGNVLVLPNEILYQNEEIIEDLLAKKLVDDFLNIIEFKIIGVLPTGELIVNVKGDTKMYLTYKEIF